MTSKPILELKDLCPEDRADQGENVKTEPFSLSLKDMEKNLIFKALEKTNGNRTYAAKILGISIRTLRNKLHEYKEILRHWDNIILRFANGHKFGTFIAFQRVIMDKLTMNRGLFDRTIQMLERSLDLSTFRHKVLSSNVANVETPQYAAKDISFQKGLGAFLPTDGKYLTPKNAPRSFR